MRQIKVLNLKLLRVLPSFHHYILGYLRIYRITTTGQIKDGKHMHRALEAHFSLYLALYKLYMSKIVDDNQEIYVSLNNQARFYRIYMKLFESILLFIRGMNIRGMSIPQIMSILLYVRNGELCKNDPCLSLGDVQPESK